MVSDADRIREFTLKEKILPAQREKKKKIVITAKEIHNSLGFQNRFPNVIQAIDGRKFQELANFREITKYCSARSGQSSTAYWEIILD
ncbi:MAG: hypothetical protein ACE5OZ_01320 [Candidatus Heimdallarchaeota archaeon]